MEYAFLFLIVAGFIIFFKNKTKSANDVKELKEKILREQDEEDRRLETLLKKKREDVLSLERPRVKVFIRGHAKRTLELRCGVVLSDDEEHWIQLIEKDTISEPFDEHRGYPFLCKLSTGHQCYIIVDVKLEDYEIDWFAKTFFPLNRKLWFKHCIAEDLLLKDDERLEPIDRIEWHDKLNEKILRKEKQEVS